MTVRIAAFLAVATLCAAGPNGDFFQAIRNGDSAALQKISRTEVNIRGPRGITLLMQAAAFGNAETVRLLIERGADVNAKNDFGATALLWAARDPVKARLLIEHGADVNAQSKQGRTPLMMASQRDGGSDIVALMLAKGADVNARDKRGNTALSLAAHAGDVNIAGLLVAKGADVRALDQLGESTLVQASRSRSPEMARLLIQKGVDVNLANTGSNQVRNGPVALLGMAPLHLAANFGPVQMVRDLIEAGANVNAADSRKFTPLMFAVAAEQQDPEIVRALIAAGANVNARAGTGETALDWAEKFGYPEVIAALKHAGAVRGIAYTAPKRRGAPKPAPAAAVERSIALLQKSSAEFFARSGCVGCHHQPLIAEAVQSAKTAGIAVNQVAAREEALQLRAQWAASQDDFLQALTQPGGANRIGENLLGFEGARIRADPLIDAAVVDLAESQTAAGNWLHGDAHMRPPISESAIASTARAIRVLTAYSIPGRKAEFTARIERGRGWIEKQKPACTDDFTLRLLGLAWAGAPDSQVRQAARDLLSLQREDGGWAGNPYLTSDAFATGRALYALHESRAQQLSDPNYRRGVEFLVSTQYPDGSWYVRSRALKFQPYFESGFPFGHDQWISAAATGWAVMALAPAIQTYRAAR